GAPRCARAAARRGGRGAAASPSPRSGAPRQRSLWWMSWTSTPPTRSTPPEPIYFVGWAETARPRPPTSAQPPWLRRTPSGRSSGSGAEVRAELLAASPRLSASLHRQRFVVLFVLSANQEIGRAGRGCGFSADDQWI